VRETGKANRSTPDHEILEFAVSDGRAMLTLNRKHFIALHALIAHSDLSGLLIRVNRPAR
jgi:hypothetical protein